MDIWCPGDPFVSIVVNQGACTCGSHGGKVIIEFTIKLCIFLKPVVESWGAEDFESYFCLIKEAVPFMHREVRVREKWTGNEVVFENDYGTFSGVAAVYV